MNERDPELEKLYREHAREEPPSALDAKILAAAHRAVDSGPRKVGEATRPQRWWMPLAAAAVIGVVAIGVVQQMPKEPAIDATSVTSAPAPASPPAQAPMNAPAPAADESKQKKEMDQAAPPQGRAAAPAPPPPPAAPKPAAKLAAASDSKVTAEPVPFPAAAPAPAPAPAVAQMPMPQKTEAASAEAKRDAPAEQAFAESRKDNAARAERQAPMTAAAPAPPPAPAAAPPTAARMRAQGESSGGMAQLGKSVGNEMQELARDPDAWIVRIRKLRDEGNTAQALRELREFRALVPDAERKLPADLKSLQP